MQTEAVLNPEPTALLSAGSAQYAGTLNGEPLDPAVPARIPAPRGQVPWWSRALAILVVLTGVAVALIAAYRTIGWTATNLAQGRDGPASGSLDGLFDASGIDFSIVGELVAVAKQDTGWDDVTSFYPSVRANDDGEPEIFVSLSNDYYSAGHTFSSDGELLDRYGDGLD